LKTILIVIHLISKRDFEEIEYILHEVNHSVWSRLGLFPKNTVKSLWLKIKRLSNNFSGLTIIVIKRWKILLLMLKII